MAMTSMGIDPAAASLLVSMGGATMVSPIDKKYHAVLKISIHIGARFSLVHTPFPTPNFDGLSSDGLLGGTVTYWFSVLVLWIGHAHNESPCPPC